MSATDSGFDTLAFREALGSFATGITVVTACTDGGERVGLTANSFNSVSLDPPLILWSLAKKAQSFPVFQSVSHYAVNVLAADQMQLSQQFATPLEDKFAGVDCHEGMGRAPLLDGCVARFECRNANSYQGGDHLIFVGEVERFELFDRPALLYHGGQYGLATRHPGGAIGAIGPEPSQPSPGLELDDFLLYLLARASHQVSSNFHAHLKAHGLSVVQWRVLASLSDGDGLPVSELANFVLTKQPTLTRTIDRMEKDGQVERRPSGDDRRKVLVRITDQGRQTIADLVVRAKEYEREILAGYGPGEEAVLKMVLRTLIERTTE